MKKEYSVKEVASLLGVSKPTVQKVINDLKKEPIRIDRGQIRVYSLDDMMDVIRVVRPGLDASEFDNDRQEMQKLPPNAEKEVQNTANECKDELQKGANGHQNLPNDRQWMQNTANALEMVLETLREELETKNRQISEKDKQIESLQATLKLAEENLARSQQLHAADKQRLLALESREEIHSESKMESPETDEENDIWESAVDKEDISEEKGTQAVFVGFKDDETFENNEQVVEPDQEPEAKRGFFARLWESIVK